MIPDGRANDPSARTFRPYRFFRAGRANSARAGGRQLFPRPAAADSG
jgi:hypothetical protein